MSAIAHGLYHLLVEHQVFFGIESFIFVFFTIWWSWMNYTWFSSAYDNDDVIFRILTFFKFFDCSCSQQELPPQWQKIQILRQYACCHGFVMTQGSKMRSKKSPYLFNICRQLDFGAYCRGVVIAIIPVIAVKCGLELIYAVFLILLGIIIYIIITHIGQSCPLTKK